MDRTKSFVVRWFPSAVLHAVLLCGLNLSWLSAQTPRPADSDSRSRFTGHAWPNWMGPRHDGISREKGWSSKWLPKGLPVIWTQQIGIGFSSITVSRNRLYTMGHVDGREYIYCFNANTGKRIWSHDYPSRLVDNLHEGGPGATPTIVGERVYTVGREGQLFCLSARNGEVVWKKLLQEDLQVEMPEWGFTSSPRIVGKRLILEAGRVVSYDAGSGKKLWQTKPHQAGYGSAAVFQSGPRRLIATLDCEGLRVVEEATGKEVAATDWESPFATNSTTPIVRGDKIFISAGYNVGCGLFQLSGNRLTEIYANREMRNHFNNSILFGNHLYGFDGNSNLGRVVRLVCMELKTGEVRWKQRGFGCGSLIVADGKLLILSDSGQLVLAKASPERFTELSRSPILEGRCWTTPTLVGGKVFARSARGTLVCVQLPTD